MTGIFDGMAGVLNSVFGAPVSHTPQGQASRTIDAVFRKEPDTVTDREGHDYLIAVPTLRVLKADAASISRGDEIEPGDGAKYVVLNQQPSGSPASDAFVVFELEEDQANV